MRRAGKSLVNLSKQLYLNKLSPKTIKSPLLLRSLSTATATTATTRTEKTQQVPSKPDKDSFILERFRLRQLKGSLKSNTQNKPSQQSSSSTTVESDDVGSENEKSCAPTEVVSSFQELGLNKEVVVAAEEMGVCVPSEIQCVGVPAILDGKSVVLSSGSGSGRTLAYLLPLVQMLIRDEALLSMKPKHPRAIVLCTTEDSADQGFRVAQLISHYARLNSSKQSGGDSSKGQENVSKAAPIGMLVGTPSEVLEQIEEGHVLCDDIKYLVLDEADTLFDHGLSPKINKILVPLKDRALESNNQGFQTILVTSTIAEMLGEQQSSLMERIEHDNAGKVTAMLLEMDPTEVFDLIESPDALKKKVAEAMDSLH